MKVYRFFEKYLAFVLLCLCSRTSVLARKAVRLRQFRARHRHRRPILLIPFPLLVSEVGCRYLTPRRSTKRSHHGFVLLGLCGGSISCGGSSRACVRSAATGDRQRARVMPG